MVAMRPEEITVLPRDLVPDGVNVVAGTVDNVEYGGRDSLLDVVTGRGVRLHVRAASTHEIGDSVRLQVPVERVLVYPHE
jgi:hypothetical protein